MVNSVNGMLILVICLYAFINGIEGLRSGGSEVDASDVIWFGAVSGLICATVGTYELWMSRRTGSQLLRNDAREWLIDATFSLVTLVGFATLFVLVGSSLLISSMRRLIPGEVRISSYILIIATFLAVARLRPGATLASATAACWSKTPTPRISPRT